MGSEKQSKELTKGQRVYNTCLNILDNTFRLYANRAISKNEARVAQFNFQKVYIKAYKEKSLTNTQLFELDKVYTDFCTSLGLPE